MHTQWHDDYYELTTNDITSILTNQNHPLHQKGRSLPTVWVHLESLNVQLTTRERGCDLGGSRTLCMVDSQQHESWKLRLASQQCVDSVSCWRSDNSRVEGRTGASSTLSQSVGVSADGCMFCGRSESGCGDGGGGGDGDDDEVGASPHDWSLMYVTWLLPLPHPAGAGCTHSVVACCLNYLSKTCCWAVRENC